MEDCGVVIHSTDTYSTPMNPIYGETIKKSLGQGKKNKTQQPQSQVENEDVPNSSTAGVPNSSTAGVPNSFTIGVPNSSKVGLPPDPLQIYGMLLVVSALRWQVFMIRPKREDGILGKVMLQDLKIVCPLSVVTSVKWIKWESLPLNMVKMNMDGASKGSSGLSGGGCNASSWKNAITPGSGRMRCAIIRNGDEFCRMLNMYYQQ
ncbi:unnamed protein product [Ilex paraguariensis]|uniref:Uncharacterized protein n=1 Tax=Ilex paraguariensis TaxID=185542 RepID=A0ABC8THQ5_9AQUA